MIDSEILADISQKMTAILALLANNKYEGDKDIKVEVVLANAGLKAPEIAKILNKNVPAVQKTLQRYGK